MLAWFCVWSTVLSDPEFPDPIPFIKSSIWEAETLQEIWFIPNGKEELIVVVILPSDLLKNISSFIAYTSKGNCGLACISFNWRAPDVWVDILPAFPSSGEGITVFVVDFDIK